MLGMSWCAQRPLLELSQAAVFQRTTVLHFLLVLKLGLVCEWLP